MNGNNILRYPKIFSALNSTLISMSSGFPVLVSKTCSDKSVNPQRWFRAYGERRLSLEVVVLCDHKRIFDTIRLVKRGNGIKAELFITEVLNCGL